jgi:hypothetical protein
VADEVADCAGRDAADAIRTAAIAAERELVEIGLQVARLDGTGVRAKQPALVLRHRSVDRLQAIFDAALGRYLYDHCKVTFPKARFVVARMAIAGNSGLGGHAGVGKSLQSLRAICARVGESHSPSVSVATLTMDFPARVPPTKASSISARLCSGARFGVTSAARILCNQVQAVL